MKKLIISALVIVMLFSLCACGDSGTLTGEEAEKVVEELEKQEQEIISQLDNPEPFTTEPFIPEPFTGMPNPMVEYKTLGEINDITGGRLCHPAVMGVTDETFFTIDCGSYTIAEYNFSVNGSPYCFRFSPEFTEDISGIYVGDGTAFSGGSTSETIDYCITKDVKAARWLNIDGQYVFSSDAPGTVDEEVFRMAAEELYELSFPGKTGSGLTGYYDSLAGDYQDSWSQRATAEVVSNGDSVTITVHWSSSASQYTEWTMTAKCGEDGLLYYNDCTKIEHTFDSEGRALSSIRLEFPEEGFFGELDGTLGWNGSGDADTENCVFEKTEQ